MYMKCTGKEDCSFCNLLGKPSKEIKPSKEQLKPIKGKVLVEGIMSVYFNDSVLFPYIVEMNHEFLIMDGFVFTQVIHDDYCYTYPTDWSDK